MKLRQGFSLIELLVVVAIIGILAAIGTVGYNKYLQGATDAAALANDKQILEAVLVEDANKDSKDCQASAEECADTIAQNNGIPMSSLGCANNILTIGTNTVQVSRLRCMADR